MNRKKYLILTAMLSLLCINKTYAACTQEEINDFKKIEDEYKITYEFNLATKDYTVTLETPPEKKYDFVIFTDINLNCKKKDEKIDICYNMPQNNYEIRIVGNTKTCNEILKTFTLKLPKYNKYSEDPLCKGIEEFVLCQPTYDKEIDRETFESRVNTYKRTKNESNLEDERQEEQIENELILYIKENLLQIIIVATFIMLVIITIIIMIKSARKSRRLEW